MLSMLSLEDLDGKASRLTFLYYIRVTIGHDWKLEGFTEGRVTNCNYSKIDHYYITSTWSLGVIIAA